MNKLNVTIPIVVPFDLTNEDHSLLLEALSKQFMGKFQLGHEKGEIVWVQTNTPIPRGGVYSRDTRFEARTFIIGWLLGRAAFNQKKE